MSETANCWCSYYDYLYIVGVSRKLHGHDHHLSSGTIIRQGEPCTPRSPKRHVIVRVRVCVCVMCVLPTLFGLDIVWLVKAEAAAPGRRLSSVPKCSDMAS